MYSLYSKAAAFVKCVAYVIVFESLGVDGQCQSLVVTVAKMTKK